MGSIETKSSRYAVIQARWSGRAPECFPIVYSDEQALRSIIAGSCILACDIASREEAIAVAQTSSWNAGSTYTGSGPRVRDSAKLRRCPYSNKEEKKKTFFGMEKVWISVSQLTSQAVATAMVVIFSRNVVGSLLRAFVGIQ